MTKEVIMKVVIYSTPKWPIWKRAKFNLDKKGINYRDIDVSASEEATYEMIHKSGQMGTQVIIIDNQVMVGFNQGKMEKMLAK